MPTSECSEQQNECNELCGIVSASVKTTEKRKKNNQWSIVNYK